MPHAETNFGILPSYRNTTRCRSRREKPCSRHHFSETKRTDPAFLTDSNTTRPSLFTATRTISNVQRARRRNSPKIEKKRLIPCMLRDRYRTSTVRRPFTKESRYSCSACSIAYTDKVLASKHNMNFSAFFICLRLNSAGRPKHARVENRVKLSNTLHVGHRHT